MRLHRFYIEKKIPYSEKTGRGGAGEITLTDPELIHQMANVFRFKDSDKVILFDGSGSEFEAEIITISKKEIKLNILSHSAKATRDVSISLYLSLIKKNNFELAAEKCTEVGVSEIHPIISERSEKKDLNLERLNKIVKEASEQSGRVTLPEVFEVTDLETAVSQAIADGKECVTFHTSSDSSTAPNFFNRPRHQNDTPSSSDEGDSLKPTAAFVGPEGGWTEKEMELFKKNNFKILSLGTNILRAETAAIAAVWSQINLNN
jgi:16S rRNA (uracil1498-N3)-methyltransferase